MYQRCLIWGRNSKVRRMQGACRINQPIFLGDPEEISSVFVGFDAIPIAVDKFYVGVRVFLSLFCDGVSVVGFSPRKGTRVPKCSLCDEGGEVWSFSGSDVGGAILSSKG